MGEITYGAIRDDNADSCGLTQPVISTDPELRRPEPAPIPAPASQSAQTPQTPTPTPTTAAATQSLQAPPTDLSGSVSGSASGSLGDSLGLQGAEISSTGFTAQIDVDLTQFQKAVEALSFDEYTDNTFTSTIASTKLSPSPSNRLAISNTGDNLAATDVLGSMLLNSNRIVLNAKQHMMMMFGAKGVAIASPLRVNIDAGESITLAAQESLFLGLPNRGEQYTIRNQKQIGYTKGDPTPDIGYEPLVLGIKLANLLEDIISVVKNAEMASAISVAKWQPTMQANFALLANRIPEMLSTYAYVDGISHEEVDLEALAALKEAQQKAKPFEAPTKLTGTVTGVFATPLNFSPDGAGGGVGTSEAITAGTPSGNYIPLNQLSNTSRNFAQSTQHLTVVREWTNSTRTSGTMWYGGQVMGFTVEDAVRTKKIKDVTAIPKGGYYIAMDTTGNSNLQRCYVTFPSDSRAKFRNPGVFPRVGSTPDAVSLSSYGQNFGGIRIHNGTSETWSSGCIIYSSKRSSDGRLDNDVNHNKALTQFIYNKKITKIVVTQEWDNKGK